MYFRITNISDDRISMTTADEIASIMFEQLEVPAEHPYSGAFQNELDFRSLGNYDTQLSAEITSLVEKVRDIKHIEKTLYGNVINIMVIFIGLFSLININFNLVSSGTGSVSELLIYNLSTLGSIAFMSAILQNAIGGKRSKALWIACIGAFAIAIALFMATHLRILWLV